MASTSVDMKTDQKDYGTTASKGGMFDLDSIPEGDVVVFIAFRGECR